MSTTGSPGLLEALFSTDAMRAIFCDGARLQGMLDFEAALARAEAKLGLIPAAAVPAIAPACHADAFDMAQLSSATASAGNPAIPMVKMLTARVAATDPEASRYAHWGATSQDVMDTGLVLQLRRALALIETDLDGLGDALASLAQQHKCTPIAGRTWLQHATPITFGLKAAGWLSAIERHRTRLAEIKPRLLMLQFGGAAGTLAALGGQGLQVAQVLAEELDLALPEMPWHTQRDRLVELATVLGLLAGTLGKIARDVSSLMQTEFAEAFEPAGVGKGGSSTMPHKRNPVGAAVAVAASMRVPGLVATMLSAMVQEHERGFGNWHAEWETLPEICLLTAGALQQMRLAMEGLEVDAERMRVNLDVTHGLIYAEAVSMALAERLGRQGAHHVVEEACRAALAQSRPLREVLAVDPEISAHLDTQDLDRLFDPQHAIGLAEIFVDRVLVARRERGLR